MALGTVIPLAIQIASDADNRVVAGAFARFTAAGTPDLLTMYADADLTVPLSNPVEASAAGRFPQIFAAPGVAYDLNITTPGGVSLPGYPAVNLLTVPVSEHPTSVIGTAGETIDSFLAAYLSDGSGGRTAGLWYLTDASVPYASSLPEIGICPAGILIGQSGVIQVGGRVASYPGTTPGAAYYLAPGPALGQLTSNGGSNPRYVGQADASGSLVLSPNPPLKTGGFSPYAVLWSGDAGTPAIGNGILQGSVLQIGKMGFVKIYAQMGSTTTYGAGVWSFSLPFTASVATSSLIFGNCIYFDFSASNRRYLGAPGLLSVTAVTGMFDNSVGYLGPTVPFTWAASDVLQLGFWVHVA